jgi:hypothetical protein
MYFAMLAIFMECLQWICYLYIFAMVRLRTSWPIAPYYKNGKRMPWYKDAWTWFFLILFVQEFAGHVLWISTGAKLPIDLTLLFLFVHLAVCQILYDYKRLLNQEAGGKPVVENSARAESSGTPGSDAKPPVGQVFQSGEASVP